MTFDPRAVRETREGLLLRLLFRTTDTMNRTMTDRIRARGYEDFQPSFTGILAHIDTEGTRVSVIAQRMGVTRQAASQRLQEIEALGYIERVPDPGDGRAVIARHTAAGRRILLTAIAAMIGAAVILADPIFQGLAISLLFGLASSTALTVLVIPAIYVVLRGDRQNGDQAAPALQEAKSS